MTKVFANKVEGVLGKKVGFTDKIGNFTDHEVRKLREIFEETPRTLKVIFSLDDINKHQHSRLGVFVKKRDIRKQKMLRTYDFIEGKARLFREGYGEVRHC